MLDIRVSDSSFLWKSDVKVFVSKVVSCFFALASAFPRALCRYLSSHVLTLETSNPEDSKIALNFAQFYEVYSILLKMLEQGLNVSPAAIASR